MRVPKIVCAASKFVLKDGNTIIVPSARHWDDVMAHIVVVLDDKLEPDREEQGFIDQYGEFHDRAQAYKIAEEQGQIVRRVGGDAINCGKLFSENLY